SAVGFSEERGDKVEIASVQFQTEEPLAAEGVVGRLMSGAPSLILKLLMVALVFGGIFYVIPAVARSLGTPGGPLGPRLTGPQAAIALTQENLALTQQNPERAAQLVREWLHESGGEPG